MEGNGLVCVGKVVGVHGLRGNLKVYPLVESLEVFEKGTRVILRTAGGDEESRVILRVTPYKNIALMMLEGIGRNEAERRVHSELWIEKDRLPEPEEDVYYWDDIIGLEVYDEDDHFAGRVASIIETGSNDVYVVRHNDREWLIPALDSVVVAIDMDHRRMKVSLPEGLESSEVK